MTDSEWIANIHNVSNAEIFEQLDQIGCDGYYGDIWSACIEELQRRVNLTSGDLTEAEKKICKMYLEDLDKTHTCNEYKLLMRLINNAPTVPERDYSQGWHDAITKALNEAYTFTTDDGTFKVVQTETLEGLGMSMPMPERPQGDSISREALAFKEEIIRMVNMGVYPEAIVEWVREREAENED